MNINDRSIKLSFVGDILPSNLQYTLGFGNYNELNVADVREFKEKPDIFFANLEAPILLKNGSNAPFSGNHKILELFHTVGINIVSIANNHILEKGKEGFFETIQLLKDQGIKVVGINENNSSNIETFKIDDQILAFAAFNAVHDIKNPSLYADLNELGVELALVKMKKANATFKILSFHWGNEYISLPNPDQIKTARFAMEKGCDLIIGHHPHVVQKIEIVKDRHVFYSLGNAYFDYLFTSTVKKGLRVDCNLAKDNFKIDYYFISSQYLSFNKIDESTDTLLLSEKEIKWQNNLLYYNWFHQKLRWIRFLYRLKMKYFLLELLFVLPVSNKLILIDNIKQVLKSKLNRQIY